MEEQELPKSKHTTTRMFCTIFVFKFFNQEHYMVNVGFLVDSKSV